MPIKYQDISINTFCQQLDKQELSAQDILSLALNCGIKFYWHPLGFILGIFLIEDIKKIRIHIWPKDTPRKQYPYWNIHDHIFSLKSWVINGKILNQEFQITKDNNSPNCIYNVSYSNEISTLYKTSDTIRVEETRQSVSIAGDSYLIEAGILHSSENISAEHALTIVLTNNMSSGTPIVIGEKEGKQLYQFSRSEVDSQYVRGLLHEF